MADIFQEVEEDLRHDRYKRLAKAYGGYVIAGVLLVILGTAGGVLWKNWRNAQEQTATLQLAEAVDRTGGGNGVLESARLTEAVEALTKVATESRSGPAGLARFYEAGLKARNGERQAAETLYGGLANDPSIAPMYRELATLLTVQLEINDADPKALAEQLAPLSVETCPWRFTARELSGLLAARTGDIAQAKTLFQQLADDNGAPAGLRVRAAELAAFYGKS